MRINNARQQSRLRYTKYVLISNASQEPVTFPQKSNPLTRFARDSPCTKRGSLTESFLHISHRRITRRAEFDSHLQLTLLSSLFQAQSLSFPGTGLASRKSRAHSGSVLPVIHIGKGTHLLYPVLYCLVLLLCNLTDAHMRSILLPCSSTTSYSQKYIESRSTMHPAFSLSVICMFT